jgi:Ca-activated chloride channel family protein
VNTKLLDFLALEHRGEADYILPEENITEKISRFFDRVGSPLMTDLEVKFEGIEVKDVYPSKIADVFKGEQVVLYGRYSGHGPKKVRVTGNINGSKKTLEYTLEFPEFTEDDKQSFVPRLWAGKKVDFLLNEIRKTTEPPKELVDEVTYLAKRYGIVTPYTSFLMAEDIMASGPADLSKRANEQLLRFGLAGAAANGAPGAPAATTTAPLSERDKQDRVRAAKEVSEARREAGKSGDLAAFDARAETYLRRDGKDTSSLAAVRYIGTRTFYKRGEEWCESVYDAEKDKDLKTVVVGSDEYLDLLKQDGRLAKYLALGDVVLKVKGKWYRFEEPGKKRS